MTEALLLYIKGGLFTTTQRITREMVVEAAFRLARERGMEGVLVKELARELHCSVQPIYTCIPFTFCIDKHL